MCEPVKVGPDPRWDGPIAPVALLECVNERASEARLERQKEQIMSVIINTEDFSLSMASRRSIESILEKLEPALPDGVKIRLFLKKAPKDLLTAIVKVHALGKDFVATKTGEDLESLVLAVETQLRRRLVELNQRRIQFRRGRNVAS